MVRDDRGSEDVPNILNPRGAGPPPAKINPRVELQLLGTTSRGEDDFLEEKKQMLITEHSNICSRIEEFEKVLPRSTSIELEKVRKESERMVLMGVVGVSGVSGSILTFEHVNTELHLLSQMLLRKSSEINSWTKDWGAYAGFVVRGMCKEVNPIIDEVESYLEGKGIDIHNVGVLLCYQIDYDISVDEFRGVLR